MQHQNLQQNSNQPKTAFVWENFKNDIEFRICDSFFGIFDIGILQILEFEMLI